MLVGECDDLDAKITWKFAETNNQHTEHIALLRQALKHTKTGENYDAQAQEIKDNTMHLLTVARQVLVFNVRKLKPNAMLQCARKLREKAENEVGSTTNYTNESNFSSVCLSSF